VLRGAARAVAAAAIVSLPGKEVRLFAPAGLPMVRAGDDLATLLGRALDDAGERLQSGDVVVFAQKVVSKAEGREVRLGDVVPSERAAVLARTVNKDARLVELVLRESREVLRTRHDVLIVEHRSGFVMANAGIDLSNVSGDGDDERALLLPEDSDASCAALRASLQARYRVPLAVIVNDSHGRAWRNGTVGAAIGASGLPALLDLRGRPDLFGRPLRITQVGLADELAAAASLLMGQADEARPVVVIRGVEYPSNDGRAADLVRPRALDLFR
jgi:coenzyme F420-0:L-glutamate ligase / coenzyme F420-1:gamma-L-glutamate ligase